MHARLAPALWTLLAAILWLAPAAPVAAQSYTVIDLGTLGGTDSYAYDLNDRGEVVGGSQAINPNPGPFYLRRGFHWAQSSMTDLGALAPHGESRAFSINEQGWIAGWATDQAGDKYPALYAEDSWTQIPHPGISGEGRGINDLGRVVGYFNDANVDAKAFAWSPLGAFVDLSLVDNAGNSLANAINHNNTVVGWSTIGPDPCGIFSASKPTVWERDSSGNWSATGLPFTGCAGNVFGLNDWNFLVGNVRANVLEPIPTQWVWRGAWFEFDLPMDGRTSGTAYDINHNSQIVGSMDQRAYLWDGGSPVDLNTEIPSGSGWVLQQAKAINDCGWITGYGRINGETHAFLLVPRYPKGCC